MRFLTILPFDKILKRRVDFDKNLLQKGSTSYGHSKVKITLNRFIQLIVIN